MHEWLNQTTVDLVSPSVGTLPLAFDDGLVVVLFVLLALVPSLRGAWVCHVASAIDVWYPMPRISTKPFEHPSVAPTANKNRALRGNCDKSAQK